jgi:hypothetical protein
MNCPSCGSPRVYPSRLRGMFERMRQMLTDKQPHRCHQCDWRQWRELRVHPVEPDAHPEDLRTGRGAAPVSQKDLDQLDSLAPRS